MKVTRKELYELVWAEPMQKVAERLEISDVYLARVCSRLNVPHPGRGYWAQLAAGQPLARPPLPRPQPGDELEWYQGGGAVRRVPPDLPKPPLRKRSARKARANRAARYPLLEGVADLFKEGRLTYGAEYYKPRKRRLPDLFVSPGTLERGLELLNGLFLSLEDRGYPVVIGPRDRDDYHRPHLDPREPPRSKEAYWDGWWPSAATVTFLGTVAIGLTLYEITESAEVVYVGGKKVRVSQAPPRHRSGWVHTSDVPSGRLSLRAYSPYRGTDWQQKWLEKKSGDLERMVEGICKGLELAAPQIADGVVDAQHQAAAAMMRWEAECRESQRREHEQRRERERREQERLQHTASIKSREVFLSIVDEWAAACRIESFAQDFAGRLSELEPDEATILADRLERARQLLGSTSAVERFRTWRTPEELLSTHP